MLELPTFRRMIKAIGEHSNPKETAYRYDLIEFRPNGSFIFKRAVLITDTQMRADGDRLYEIYTYGELSLISKAEFEAFKRRWDELHAALGYSPVDEFGQAIALV